MSKQFEAGYNKGVITCIDIMGHLDDKYGDYTEAHKMYLEFLNRLRKLKTEQNK